MFQSEIYEVWDTLAHDMVTESHDIWLEQADITTSVTDGVKTHSNTGSVYRQVITALEDTSTVKMYPLPFIIEFDLESASNLRLNLYDGSTQSQSALLSRTGKITIIVESNSQIFKLGNEVLNSNTNSLGTQSRFSFGLSSGTSVSFKNFKVYSI